MEPWWGGGGNILSEPGFRGKYSKITYTTCIFLNIFVQDCSSYIPISQEEFFFLSACFPPFSSSFTLFTLACIVSYARLSIVTWQQEMFWLVKERSVRWQILGWRGMYMEMTFTKRKVGWVIKTHFFYFICCVFFNRQVHCGRKF